MPNPRDYFTASPGKFSYTTNTGGAGGWDVAQARIAQRFASDYSRKKPAGRRWLPPSSYSSWSQFEDKANGSIRWTHPTQGVNTEVGYVQVGTPTSMLSEDGGPYGISKTFEAEVANRALLKARAKAKRESVNLAQVFYERHQTARLVAANIKRIAEFFTGVDPRRIRYTLRGLLRDVPQFYLEWQYGVKPLLMDIHGAVEALDARKRDEYVVTVKAGDKIIREFNGPRGAIGTKERRMSRLKVMHGSFVRIDMIPQSQALATAASLGFTNPLNLAWELTHASFVLDYLLPLGDYFSQFDALAGWEVLGYSQSNLTRLECEFTGLSHFGGGWQWENGWKSKLRYVRLDRTAGTSVPFATLPRVKEEISGRHVVNALALLASALNPYRGR